MNQDRAWAGIGTGAGAGGEDGAFDSGDSRQEGFAEARYLDDQAFAVLPHFAAEALLDALRCLTPAEQTLALQHKIVAITRFAEVTHYACVTLEAEREAARRGMVVVARIDREDFRRAVFEAYGPELLRHATFHLAKSHPSFSARVRLMHEQWLVALIFVLLAVAAALWSDPGHVYLALSLMAGVFFAMTVAIRIFSLTPIMAPLRPRPAPLPTDALPVYSVLVPLFKETSVLNQLLGGLMALNYPTSKLDIKLILEEGDAAMRQAVQRLHLPEHFEVIIVPRGQPQTKPRALNYALPFVRGSLLTIYDGEDIPERNQLRKAAARFAAEGNKLACLQAVLTFYNPNENWLSRQFTAEYAALFNVMLPQLAACGLPLPLGGTSNHFRTASLLAVGGWDPFNVTEDADLGYRLARLGHETGVLESRTYEEANIHLGNWMKQRRRWLKGFLHTWLVHMRHPFALMGELGISGFWLMQCLTMGVFASALLHPFLLAHAVWFFASGEAREQLALPWHGWAVGLNGAILILGYGAAIFCARQGLRQLGYRGWASTLLSMPLYWLLLTPAAWLGLWDFIVRPHHWHKTEHGLSSLFGRRKGSARARPTRSFSRASSP